jgi:nitrite reductase/ring-hydroxylating ferredoxin subunit
VNRPRPSARVASTPPHLAAPGTASSPFEPVLPVADLPPGAFVRVSRGDLDLLLAHVPDGILATDDRCPHMAAPLSLGRLAGCVVDCPLHNGRFDLCTGETVQLPRRQTRIRRLRYYPVRIAAGIIEVALPRP